MIKFFGPAQDDAGNKLIGYSVRILDSGGAQVAITADEGGTNFQPTANLCPVDDNGMVQFWYTPEVGQVYQLLNPEGLIETSIPDFSSSEATIAGKADLSTYSTLTTLKAAPASTLAYNLTDTALAGVFFYETANAPYTADDVNVIKLDSIALSVGALVRQKANSVQTLDGSTVEGRLDRYQVASIAAIEALSPLNGDTAYLRQNGLEGSLVFSSSDLSTQVAIDTASAIYIAPDSDATGASGAWVRKFDGPAKPEWGGGSLDTVIPIYRDLGVKSVLLEGDYSVATEVDIGDLEILGQGATVTQSGTQTALFSATGSLSSLPGVSGNLAEGDQTVLFASDPGLAVGDIFGIYNPTNGSYQGTRIFYRAGEWCEVIAVSGNTVTTKRPLQDSYVSGDITLHKLASKAPKVTNVRLETTTAIALNFSLCRDVIVENITGTCDATSQIQFSRCYNVVADDCFLTNNGSGSAVDYAIVLANTQHARVRGGNLYARRHPVATGGGDYTMSVPCDDIKVIGSTLSNLRSSGVDCADFHGNTRNSEYLDCIIHGSAKWAGKNNGYRNCQIGSSSIHICILATEILGGRHYATNCDFVTNGNPGAVSRGVFDIGGNAADVFNADTLEDTVFEISGGSIKGTGLVPTTNIVRAYNRGSTKKLNILITDVKLDLNTAVEFVRTQNLSGTADSDFIIIDRLANIPADTVLIKHQDGAYLNFPHRLQAQAGTQTIEATSGTNNSNGAFVDFAFDYPRDPVLLMSPPRIDGAIFNGNRAIQGHVRDLSPTQFRMSLMTADGVNWSATVDAECHWQAGLWEV